MQLELLPASPVSIAKLSAHGMQLLGAAGCPCAVLYISVGSPDPLPMEVNVQTSSAGIRLPLPELFHSRLVKDGPRPS